MNRDPKRNFLSLWTMSHDGINPDAKPCGSIHSLSSRSFFGAARADLDLADLRAVGSSLYGEETERQQKRFPLQY
ncbi:MAG: hypothetical protein ACI9HK_000547 [Pirellulaceae bacterium]